MPALGIFGLIALAVALALAGDLGLRLSQVRTSAGGPAGLTVVLPA